jgi:hypothetical protein
MIINTLTLVPPSGASLTLGSVTYTGGHAVGHTIDTLTLDAAGLSSDSADLAFVNGGTVQRGKRGVRRVAVSGRVLGRTATEVNAMRRQLIEALGDFGAQLTAVRFNPEGTALELRGRLDGAVSFDRDGSWLTYTFTVVCPDPVAYDYATTKTINLPGTAVNAGNAVVYPTITIDGPASGTITALRVTNGSAPGVPYLALTGIALTSGKSLTIVMTPGYESVTLDGLNVLAKRTSDSAFWGVQPGANALTVTVTGFTGGTGAVTGAQVSWRDGWVS